MHQTRLYFNDIDIFLDAKKEEILNLSKVYRGKIEKTIKNHFENTNFDLVSNDIESLYYYNAMDYFSLLCYEKMYYKIDENTAKYLVDIIPLYCILSNEKFVNRWNILVKDKIVSNPKNIELITNTLECIQTNKKFTKHLPKALEEVDYNNMIRAYLESDDIDLETLKLLQYHEDKNTFQIDISLRPKIKEKHKKELNKFLKKESVHITEDSFEVYVSEDSIKEFEFLNNGNSSVFRISKQYLDEQKDELSVFKTFFKLCALIDKQSRINNLENSIPKDSLSMIFESRQKNKYGSHVFERIENSYQCIFNTLYSYFSSKATNLENAINYFVNIKFNELTNGKTFISNLSATGNLKEKYSNLFSNLEHMLNQYYVYIKCDDISEELIEELRNRPGYSQLPTKVKNKYIEINEKNKEIDNILNTLFSYQSRIAHIQKNTSCNNFIELITKCNVCYDDFRLDQQKFIDKLIEYDLLENNGFIKIKSIDEINFLNEIYQHRFVNNYIEYDYNSMNFIDKMVKLGWIKYQETLLSSYEADYFDYYFTKKKFSNSLELRNKAAHARDWGYDEEKLEINYLRALRVYLILLLKIYYELALSKNS